MSLDNHNRLLAISAMPPMGKPTLGGNHRYLRDMLGALASAGFELHLISDEPPAYAGLLEELDSLGVVRRQAPFCTNAAAAAASLDRALRELNPALVHVNGHQGWLAPSLLASGELPRARRKLFTMHLPVASLAILDAGGWRRFVPGSWSRKTVSGDRRFLPLFDRILSVSRRFGEGLADHGMCLAEQVEVIPNAVDVDRFQPAERPAGQTCIIGGAGNLTEQKAFDALIEAFARVAEKQPAVELHIAGEGEDQRMLEELAQRLGVESKVRFLGFQRDMAAFYNSLDVFVLSSAYEAAPFVALEAAACGAPAVLTDVGDIRYLFENGVHAWIVPPRDVPALAEKIGELAEAPEMRRRFSEAGRKLIVERYSKPIWEERMAELFKREAEIARR